MRRLIPALFGLVPLGCPVSIDEQPRPAATGEEASATPAASTSKTAPWSPPTGPMAPRGSMGTYTSVPVRLDVRPPDDPDPTYTQAALLAGPHVTFSGIVVCEACVGGLILRIVPFQDPSLQLSAPPGPLTTLTLSAAGPFRIAVPVGKDPVEVELLIDTDGDGHPSRGERQANVVGKGELTPDQDRTGFVLDGTEPMASPWSGASAPGQPPSSGGS